MSSAAAARRRASAGGRHAPRAHRRRGARERVERRRGAAACGGEVRQPGRARERALEGVMATCSRSRGRKSCSRRGACVRSPAFTIAAVLTLALAIGANAAIFAVVERVLLNPLPYPESDRLIDVTHAATRLSLGPTMGITRGYYFLYRERAHTLDGIALYQDDRRDGDRRRRPAAHQGDPRHNVVRQRHAGVAGSGSLVYGRGGSARRAAARGVVVRVVDAPLRRRQGHHRKADLAVWRVHRSRRRHAAVVRVS